MKIVCLLFDDITALDAIGPCEVLTNLPGAELTFAAPRVGPVRSERSATFLADVALADVHEADILLVPGGFGTRRLQHDAEVLAWLRALDRTTRVTASVCTGSILLAAAGLLRGRRATTHWAFFEQLERHGAEGVHERVVRDGKYATAAGVSAGIDLALTLALELSGQEAAEAVQLAIEYDPAPPLHAGRPDAVSPALRERLYALMHSRDAQIQPS